MGIRKYIYTAALLLLCFTSTQAQFYRTLLRFFELSSTPGQIIKSDGSNIATWGSLALDELRDVDATSPTNDQVLQYSTSSGNWEAQTINIPSQYIWNVDADSGGPAAVVDQSTLDLEGGTNVSTTRSTNKVTFDWSATLGNLSNVNTTGASIGRPLEYNGTTWVVGVDEIGCTSCTKWKLMTIQHTDLKSNATTGQNSDDMIVVPVELNGCSIKRWTSRGFTGSGNGTLRLYVNNTQVSSQSISVFSTTQTSITSVLATGQYIYTQTGTISGTVTGLSTTLSIDCAGTGG